jgi:hypothetical protein
MFMTRMIDIKKVENAQRTVPDAEKRKVLTESEVFRAKKFFPEQD